MPHRHPHKPVHHIKPNYKRLALIAAAAAVMATTTLPGIPLVTAYASPSTSASSMSATTSQQVGRTNDSSSQINANTTMSPAVKIKPKVNSLKHNTTKKPVPHQKTKQSKNKAPIISQNTGENVKTTPESTKENSKKDKVSQPNKNTTQTKIHREKSGGEVNPASQNNPPNHYKDILDISATAYAPGPHDNEQWGTKTFIGTEVRPGIIAVDPNLIPLGTRVYIEYPDGHGEYATAEDTGGAIKGNRIDIAMENVTEAEDFGIQNVKVYVISTPKNT